MISTYWNCSGVHNQIWMLRYITAAEYSWNGSMPSYLSLSDLEKAVQKAAGLHYTDNRAVCDELNHAIDLIDGNLAERDSVFSGIKTTWEKSQFPKGMSTPEKKYVHARDQQRNFANRRPDLSFMICDEQALGLEEYRAKLIEYIGMYKSKYLSD